MASFNTEDVIEALQPVVACAEDIAHSGAVKQTVTGSTRTSIKFQDIDELGALVGRTITAPHSYLTVVKNKLLMPNDTAGRRVYLDFQHIGRVGNITDETSALNGLVRITVIKIYQALGHWRSEHTHLTPNITQSQKSQTIVTNETITLGDIQDIEQIHDLGRSVCVLARQLATQ